LENENTEQELILVSEEYISSNCDNGHYEDVATADCDKI
jgi:hypothetical protein